jgi:opacity protein-like surface antigen
LLNKQPKKAISVAFFLDVLTKILYISLMTHSHVLKEIKMKKILIAASIALAAASASALEVGLTTGKNLAKTNGTDCGFVVGPSTCTQGTDRTEYGITVGKKFGKVGITAGFARSNGGSSITQPTDGAYKDQVQDRYSLVAGYDVAKISTVTITPKLGVSYLNNARDTNGYAMTAGIGASMPITKQISLTADYARQYGQDRVNQFNGDRVTAGVTYRF